MTSICLRAAAANRIVRFRFTTFGCCKRLTAFCRPALLRLEAATLFGATPTARLGASYYLAADIDAGARARLES